MTKGIPLIIKQTLSKKAQDKNDRIKSKLHTADSNLNYWKLQLNWNNLKWVNQRSKILRKTLIQLLQKYIY